MSISQFIYNEKIKSLDLINIKANIYFQIRHNFTTENSSQFKIKLDCVQREKKLFSLKSTELKDMLQQLEPSISYKFE